MLLRRLRGWLLALAAAVWSGWFVIEALKRWQFARYCAMTCDPFYDPVLTPELEQRSNWQASLGFACWPFALAALWWLLLRLWRWISTACKS